MTLRDSWENLFDVFKERAKQSEKRAILKTSHTWKYELAKARLSELPPSVPAGFQNNNFAGLREWIKAIADLEWQEDGSLSGDTETRLEFVDK